MQYVEEGASRDHTSYMGQSRKGSRKLQKAKLHAAAV